MRSRESFDPMMLSPSRDEVLFEQEREEFFSNVQMPSDIFPGPQLTRKRRAAGGRDNCPTTRPRPPARVVEQEAEGGIAPKDAPSRKLRKMAHAEPSEKDLVVGDVVSLRFGEDVMADSEEEKPTVLARVVLKEAFGVFVSVASQSPMLPLVTRGERYWARFYGDMTLDGLYVLDVVHEGGAASMTL